MASDPTVRSTDWPEIVETSRYPNWRNDFAALLTGGWWACHQSLLLVMCSFTVPMRCVPAG